ncbi:WD repeat protein [Aulographum hederae CBS 113979]|uniref:WD repeat protein n=1 Tax=Aulographum hederae CBS 113979 TaxID=1176131 RepID=A0A6G1GRC3_9PEZI|nr:WD repeat protein [Aulographum hederae CBS 113979]
MNDDEAPVDEDTLRQFVPASFGQNTKESNIQTQIEKSRRKVVAVPEPKQLLATYGSSSEDEAEDKPAAKVSDDDDDDDDDDDEDEDDEFPVSHEMVLKTHERPVTTITLDPSGARMITGSMDCFIKLHDFSSMTPTTIRAFKTVNPAAGKASANDESHPINQVLFNPISPTQVLVITAFPQGKIFDRDGELWVEFVKGDMYLRDMKNTKGHISEITCGAWHPTNPDLCVTAGTDSTLRIWDVNNKRSQKEVIVHKSRAAGSAGRTRMTAVAWRAPVQGGDNILVAAALDGSLVMWIGEGPYSRPTGEIRDAHVRDTWTSGIDISPDGRLVVTRGGDDTIKLWDTRKFKKPITTVTHPSSSSQYPTSNICFSPSGSNIVTGSSTGNLHILNPATLKSELITPVTPGSTLITVLWHPKLNQIITGSANAQVHLLYNPTTSTAGAKAVMSRAPKRRHIDDNPNLTMDLTNGLDPSAIITPGAGGPSIQTSHTSRHPLVGLTASGRSRDPRRPYKPDVTPFAKGNPDEKHVKESIPLSSMRDEDPREALLKYADRDKDPIFTSAWTETQPKTIYGELSEEEDEEGPEAKKVKR